MSSAAAMLGVISLDKPVGPTSHDMVGLMRRLAATRRVGHAGTLDPLASGVLPILLGPATRLSEELSGGDKRYLATIALGARSRTDDAEGPVEPSGAPLPGRAAVEAALGGFLGSSDQRPPAFSARKLGGRVAHRAARAGAPLALPPRRVTIHALELLDLIPSGAGVEARVAIHCGPGTYIRALARDVGELLGCGAYLAALRRTEASGLRVADALTPEALTELASAGRLARAVTPLADLLPMPRLDLGAAEAGRFLHGAAVAQLFSTGGRVAVFADGRLLGIGELRDAALWPRKVLADEPARG